MALGHVTLTPEVLYEEQLDLAQLTCRLPARTLCWVFEPVSYLHWVVLMCFPSKLDLHAVRREG